MQKSHAYIIYVFFFQKLISQLLRLVRKKKNRNTTCCDQHFSTVKSVFHSIQAARVAKISHLLLGS